MNRPERSRGLGPASIRGAIHGASGQSLKLLINLTSLVVLARLLTPSDYGLVAMVAAIVGIAELLRDMGLSTAAIQASTLNKAQRSNLWWLNTLLGTLAAGAVAVSAPAIAAFYGDSRLIPITWALSANLALAGATTQFRVDYVRSMRYGQLATIEVLAGILALVGAIYTALAGWGYWALVTQQLLNGILTLIVLCIGAGWLPGPYRRSEPVRPYLSFGLPVFASNILTYASQNLDSLLVGRFFGDSTLGHYNRGQQLVRMPMNQLRSPLNTVALRTLSQVHGSPDVYLRFVKKAQLAVIYPVGFAATLLAASADSVVPIVLGPGWDQVAMLVTFFVLGDAISTLASAGGWIYLSSGRSAALMRYTFLSTAVRIALILMALPFGLFAVASVYVVAAILLWPISLHLCGRAARMNTRPLLEASAIAFGYFVILFVVSFSSTLLLDFMPLPQLFTVSAIHICTAAVLALLIPRVRRDLRTVTDLLQSAFSRTG